MNRGAEGVVSFRQDPGLIRGQQSADRLDGVIFNKQAERFHAVSLAWLGLMTLLPLRNGSHLIDGIFVHFDLLIALFAVFVRAVRVFLRGDLRSGYATGIPGCDHDLDGDVAKDLFSDQEKQTENGKYDGKVVEG